jgi:ATP-binding cassette, subfamily B, bacterial CvaB/MchF/RaxB
VLLARALYRKLRILFMDEGTSNLDLDKEREVNRALAELKITRIVIAHRPDTIRAADRIVVLREGRVSPPMDADALAFAEAARQTLGTFGRA